MPKTLGPHATFPVPSPGPPLCSLHSLQLTSAGLLEANPNPRWAHEWPIPRGLVLQCWGLGTAKPQCQIHPVTKPPHGQIRALLLIQGGRKGRVF